VKRIVIGIGSGVVLLAAAGWLLFEHVVAWLPMLAALFKTVTLKSVAGYGIVFIKRLFLFDLPKRAVTGYGWIFLVTPRSRVRLRRTVRRLRERASRLSEAAHRRYAWLFGPRQAFLAAVVVSGAVFAFGLVYLGWFVFVWIGSAQLLRWGGRALRFALGYARDWVLQIAAFMQLDKAAAWLLSFLPRRHRTVSRAVRVRLARRVIRHRTRIAAALRRRRNLPSPALPASAENAVGEPLAGG